MRQNFSFFWATAILSAGLMLPAACEEPGANTEEQDLLLKTLITQNDATLKQIESSPLYVSFSWHNTLTTEPLPGANGKIFSGALVIDGKSRYWKHGRSFHQDNDILNRWPDSNEVFDASTIFVVNDQYCAHYYKQFSELHLFHFDDRANPYPAAKVVLDAFPQPDIMEFGIRLNFMQSLREAFEQETVGNPPPYRWTPVELTRNEQSMYLIRSEQRRVEGTRLSAENVLDPQRGFLISESRAYDKTGDAFWVLETQFQKIRDNVWFPKSATRKLTDREDTIILEVNEVKLGDPIAETMFTLESMNIARERTMMYEYSNAGRQRTMKCFMDGQWVPYETLPPERKEVIKKARRAHMDALEAPDQRPPQQASSP